MSEKDKKRFIQTPQHTDIIKYNELLFGKKNGELPAKDTRADHALKLAHDIRKFEIDLYWKRTSHFWVFLCLVLGGFGIIALQISKDFYSNSEPASLPILVGFLVILSAMGTIISWIWICVMRGSKFWQENWEQHINMLEEPYSGNLHRTIYTKRSEHYSVSRLSEAVGWVFFIACSLAYLCSTILLAVTLGTSCKSKVILLTISVSVVSMAGALVYIVHKCTKNHAKMEFRDE